MKKKKFFSNLEKKKAETKVITRLIVNGKVIQTQHEILEAQKKYSSKLYEKQRCQESQFDFFNNSINKLSEIEKETCDDN